MTRLWKHTVSTMAQLSKSWAHESICSVVTRAGLSMWAAMVRAGHRAFMLYVVQRDDCDRMTLAADLDPDYCAAFTKARAEGVEPLVYRAILSPKRISLGRALPFQDPARA